jgi:hypothetical protein
LKTDNSYFNEKVQLRLDCIKGKKCISVLDCFSGTGRLWQSVKSKSKVKILITQIEKEPGKNKMALPGDNLKYLKSIDLSKFDIIDLDAYGIPIAQLNILFDRNYKGIVIVTAIQSMLGSLPKKLLYELGYTKQMIDKIPTLFNRNGIDKLKNYLYLHSIQSIEGYFIDRKNYFYFNLNSKL